MRIGEITHKHKNGEICINSSDRARKIISDFKSQLGLLVRLYKSYNQTYIPLNENENLKTTSLSSDRKKNYFNKSNEEDEVDADAFKWETDVKGS